MSGLIANLLSGGLFGLIGDIIVGLIGSIVGKYLLDATGMSFGGGIFGLIATGASGAIALLLIFRLFKHNQ